MLGNIGVMRAELMAVELTPVHESVLSWQGEWVYLKVVVSGSIVVEHGGQFQRFGPGSVIALDPAHHFNELVPEWTDLIVLRVPKVRLQERGWSPHLNGLIALDRDAPDTAAVRNLVSGIAEQTGTLSLAMQNLLGNQLFELAEVVMTSRGDGGRRRSAEAVVYRAKAFIRMHLDSDELNAATAASAVNVSAKHLQRLFADSGQSFMRYVWQTRLEHAQILLRSQGTIAMSVQEVAWQCGFTSAAHFSRVYSAHFGYPPGRQGDHPFLVPDPSLIDK